MGDYETILYDVADGLATLTLNRPDPRNGMTSRTMRETHEAVTRAAADPSIRALVWTGAGKSLCPGADRAAHAHRGERRHARDVSPVSREARPGV